MPRGCPTAIAPPLTLTIWGFSPSSRIEANATAANASLISTTSSWSTEMPSRSSALLIALAGCDCSVESGPATTPWAPISASQVSPSSWAFSWFMTTTAAAPSEICDADPAVMVPSPRNAGFRPASAAAVVLARIPSSSVNCSGSPVRCGMFTGITSSANTPSFHAAAAFWWDAAAYSSCSERVNMSTSLRCSVSAPIG
ncbi:Uncharacterised protein [Mycobacterium tuberculosis]|nr:Uncharacterised protein [Mycobacterium tuberculosis]CKS30993.1 Uncharacterised protein [Mycobacterium tuberculosis]CNM70499.1 Uncharacterised protein [Mycobacterium tuberculosis]CNM92778.1 Uncharacterised protein [Mycobacterium tuberculosis]